MYPDCRAPQDRRAPRGRRVPQDLQTIAPAPRANNARLHILFPSLFSVLHSGQHRPERQRQLKAGPMISRRNVWLLGARPHTIFVRKALSSTPLFLSMIRGMDKRGQ